MIALHKHPLLGRAAAVLAIAALAIAAALLAGLAGVGGAVGGKTAGAKLDDFFFDAFYRLRPQQSMRDADVVLVAVDDASLNALNTPWPMPRKYWGDICQYLDQAGAKLIVFDIVFPNPSYFGDDDAFAAGVSKTKVPIVFGAEVRETGDFVPLAPKKIENPTLAAVNLGDDKLYRRYLPEKFGQPSEAEMAVIAAGMNPDELLKRLAPNGAPFLLHYYGPHKRADGQQTFRFVPAYNVIKDYQGMQATTAPGTRPASLVDPAIFKGKIVIVCAIALGTFDLKSSPLSDEYPGAEVQATAMENMLRNQQVHVAPGAWGWLTLLAGALLVTAGIVLPRRAWVKVLVPVAVVAGLLWLCIALFCGQAIWWLSPVQPLLAIVVAAPLAFGFTYFAEDRQRRFMLKALSKVVSPAIAEQLAREPGRLALGTRRSELTVLFTDLANFTDLAEGMDVQDLGKLVNRYLGEMSTQVFRHDGTLDKYIGDAVMCFWNAPLPQKDHAQRACRAALAMLARERELQTEFAALSKKRIFTRIGINTAHAAVGFIGSEHLFNYTALGDGINLASRLEGANKVYGSQILLAQSTAELVRDAFYIRQLDVLRVKGKQQPMPVFELLAARAGGAPDAALQERIVGYESAFAAYLRRDWDGAEQKLLELCQRFGEDGPAQALLERVRQYRQESPAPDWDGVYVSKTK